MLLPSVCGYTLWFAKDKDQVKYRQLWLPKTLQEAEITGVPPSSTAHPQNDVKKGFVYKRVPHVTLKSIANNEEIDAIHLRSQERLEPLRRKLNELLGEKREEWQIPRQPGDQWPRQALEVHAGWWRLRQARQKEIDASIARRAETELLYDQPYEDANRVRVGGPFTVESLSPHRVVAAEQERPATEAAGEKGDTAGEFVNVILESLRKAGVQNTIRNERLKFDRLEPFGGLYIFVRHAYFTGADQPYEKLKRSLKAEVDEAAWSALYSTTSRPFDPPATGKIAVKVINHYGDEVLKVFAVE